MIQYIKNGVSASNKIILDGMQIINPVPEQLVKAGYIPEEIIENADTENDRAYLDIVDEIRHQREKQYKLRSDSYFIASQKYLALGDLKKSEEFKTLWLKEIEAINNEYPYEGSTTTESIT